MQTPQTQTTTNGNDVVKRERPQMDSTQLVKMCVWVTPATAEGLIAAKAAELWEQEQAGGGNVSELIHEE